MKLENVSFPAVCFFVIRSVLLHEPFLNFQMSAHLVKSVKNRICERHVDNPSGSDDQRI